MRICIACEQPVINPTFAQAYGGDHVHDACRKLFNEIMWLLYGEECAEYWDNLK
jgi:hypothetical protein